MRELLSKSAMSIAELIRTKEVSAREVVQIHLEQIDKVNPTLNAVVQLAADRAIREAIQADKILENGSNLGPLHGVPMTIKDSLDTEGVISTGGTKGRQGYLPASDATVVSRLRRAGAILLGKTNTPELTLSFDTDNLIYGPTKNPFDLKRSPGGSSGGAAAAISANCTPFDIGSDFGGSIRLPAHYCGITGIKPTSGRVPRTGHIYPFGGYLDHLQQLGPMSRHVHDLYPILRIIAGPDKQDPAIIPMPLVNPSTVKIEDVRVGFYTNNGVATPTLETVQTIEQAAFSLENTVRKVGEFSPSSSHLLSELCPAIYSSDGGAASRRLLRTYGTRQDSPNAQSGNEPTGTEIDAIISKWDTYRATMQPTWNDFDVLLCPVNASPATPPGEWVNNVQAFSYTMAHNLTGWPAAVVRFGTSNYGLPIGVQIVAPPWREEVALAVALYLERESDNFQPPGVN